MFEPHYPGFGTAYAPLVYPPPSQEPHPRPLERPLKRALKRTHPFKRPLERVLKRPAAERRNSGQGPGGRFLFPFFPAMLVAMYLGALLISRVMFPPQELPELLPLPELPPYRLDISSAFLAEPEIVADEVMERYLASESREWVIDFFARICGSAELAGIILEESERRGVSPSLAFALCWEESRYNSRAQSRRNWDGSVDRGLFQLNSASFPRLAEADFFNPRTNASYGMAHLRLCLDTGGSEIAGLAMYNAGSVRVRSGGTPKQTLDYTDRILSSRRKIDAVFREEWSAALTAALAAAEVAAAAAAAEESAEPVETPRGLLLMLSPL